MKNAENAPNLEFGLIQFRPAINKMGTTEGLNFKFETESINFGF
jgi:hypothetical protein